MENTFDILLFIVCLGSGILSFILPKKTWHMLQSKKIKEKMEYTDKTEKTMRIMGIVLVVISIFFAIVSFVLV